MRLTNYHFPTAQHHMQTAQAHQFGHGLVAYHGLQEGSGMWGKIGKFVKPIAASGGKAGLKAFMDKAQSGDIKGAFKAGAKAGLDASAKSAQAQIKSGQRPF